MTTRALPVPEGLDGLRLDVAVSRLFGLSRTVAAGLLDTGAVVVAGKDGRKSDRVSTGEWLEVTLPVVDEPTAVAEAHGQSRVEALHGAVER